MTYDFSKIPPSLDSFWMPFTPQRWFKREPRFLIEADGMYYKDETGREILDGVAGLWCVNAGHNNPYVKEAVTAQLTLLDYAPNFKKAHPTGFEAANRLVDVMPEPFSHVFFSNSGSEAVDSALKIAIACHRSRGEGTRRVLIGRERGYHGVGFGGISVGGIPYNRAAFGQLLPAVDHMPHTLDLDHNAFSRGQPAWGAHLADELERIVKLHDPMNVAAVIVEPVAGSTGILPPPQGYLERLREICDEYGLLLIFDEVVTAFGRMGEYSSAPYFGVMPDIITAAKGLTNGTVPMGATFVTGDIYESFMNGPEYITELMHGYTYSGHPLAAAAAIGTLDALADGILDNATAMMQPFEDALHSLKGKPRVTDLRNCGILGAIEVEYGPEDDKEKWAREIYLEAFRRGVMIRYVNNIIEISPPLILEQSHIDHIFTTLGAVLDSL